MNTNYRVPIGWRPLCTNLMTILLAVCLLTACLDVPGIGDAGKDIGEGIEEVGEGIEDVADAAEKASQTAAEIAADTMNTTTEIARETLDALAAAIATLDQNSAEWQQVLKDLQAQMTRDAQSTLRNEVTILMETSIAASGRRIPLQHRFRRRPGQGTAHPPARQIAQRKSPGLPAPLLRPRAGHYSHPGSDGKSGQLHPHLRLQFRYDRTDEDLAGQR